MFMILTLVLIEENFDLKINFSFRRFFNKFISAFNFLKLLLKNKKLNLLNFLN